LKACCAVDWLNELEAQASKGNVRRIRRPYARQTLTHGLHCALSMRAEPDIKTTMVLSTNELRTHQQSPQHLIDLGVLSDVHVEAVLRACMRHDRLLPDGQGAAFLMADDTGVGKGRQLGGIVGDLEALRRARAKHIWTTPHISNSESQGSSGA
jgi:P-loop containing NTP hydrolase pore-1